MGKSGGSAAKSRKRRGDVNGADEPPAQKPKLTTGGGKAGVTASDGAGTPRIHAKGPRQVSEEASTKGGKKGKVGKGIQAVKAPGEPGAKTSEQHKVEGGGEGTERGSEQVGEEGSGILIFTQQLEEKAEILRTEAPMRVENEEGKGRKESEMGHREAIKAEDKPSEEHRSKEPEMRDGEAVKAEDKPEKQQRSKEPEMGGPEPLKSEGAEEISGGEEEKRVDPQAGYAGRVP
jgi:hypothetical protein